MSIFGVIRLVSVSFCSAVIYVSLLSSVLWLTSPLSAGAPTLIAMGKTPETQDSRAPARQDAPGGSPSDKKPSKPSELSRQAVSRKTELKKAIAQSMRNDAYALQEQRRFREAALLYRESLAYWPDVGLDTYVRSLEERSGLISPGKGTSPQGTASGAGRDRMVLATFRNRSTIDVTVRPDSNTEGTGYSVLAGDIVTLPARIVQGQGSFSVLVNGKIIASAVWYEDPGFAGGVPCLLFDTTLPGGLVVMTGLRKEGM